MAEAAAHVNNTKQVVMVENGTIIGITSMDRLSEVKQWVRAVELSSVEEWRQRKIHIVPKDEREVIREAWIVPTFVAPPR